MSVQKSTPEYIGQRLVSAREALGLTIRGAAKKLGFNNYQTLSDIEKGKRNINAHELVSMAKLYGRTLDYFLGQETAPDPVPLWRKPAETKEAETKGIQREFLEFLEQYSNLERLLKLKRRWKDIQTGHDREDFLQDGFALAHKLAAWIHGQLDLGTRPACNLLQVLENNLRFKILHLPLAGVSGACIVDNALGVGILINENDAPWRRNFDLAHELFHVITWDVFSREEIGEGTKKTPPEQYADAFAASLLLPEDHLNEALEEVTTDGVIRLVDVVELAKDFGVSSEVVLWRLMGINVLNRSQVQKILSDPDFRDMDKKLREGLYQENPPTRFPGRFISLACRCLMEGRISRGLFAQYVHIHRAEIDKFLLTEGFVEQNYEKIASA
ncbi:MAG TPA: XRE family transcriptional regulator [Deltaproteobacteria bacterium]|nr:XRE family transcriptional regulator [Deltaproteobacteria bacterium]